MDVTTIGRERSSTIGVTEVYGQDKPQSGASEAIAAIFISIFIVGIIGNSVVIYVLLRKRKTWSITTTYLFNLSIADAVFVCTLPLWAHAYLHQMEWNFGVFPCKLVGTATSLNMFASIFFLTAMSVDRYVAVTHATTASAARNSTVARIVCVIIWVVAFSMSVPRLIYQNVAGPRRAGVNSSRSNEVSSDEIDRSYTTAIPSATVLKCAFGLPQNEYKRFFMGLLEFVQVLIGFIIPMFVICVCYLLIVRTVRMKLISKRVKKERVALLAGIIVSAFFICWLPAQLMTLYSALAGWWKWFDFDANFHHKFHSFCVCLAYANSCINPFVYAFTATNFKNNVKEVCGSNVNEYKEAKAYRMTVAKDGNRLPFTPDKVANAESQKLFITSSADRKKLSNENEAENIRSNYSSSDNIYEPFNRNGNLRDEKLGARGPPECHHLEIQDTTSGIYYEYFSSPPALYGVAEGKDHKVTTRADIINHNNQPEISDAVPAEQSVVSN